MSLFVNRFRWACSVQPNEHLERQRHENHVLYIWLV